MQSLDDFQRVISERGWLVFNNVLPLEFVERMKADLYSAHETCHQYQKSAGLVNETAYTAHHLIGQGETFLEYIDLNPIGKYIESYFEGNYILNSFGGAINIAKSKSYANSIHRDIRTFSGNSNLILNTLIMLDDFTVENGATELLSGSHHSKDKPSVEHFDRYSEPAVGERGSILFFNSNVWHRGGVNTTDRDRSSVTPMYSKPFMKQQFDYPRAVGYENMKSFSEQAKQILGFNSRVPSSLEEWYRPVEDRMYKNDQG